MKGMVSAIMVLAILFSMAGCFSDSQETTSLDNPNVIVNSTPAITDAPSTPKLIEPNACSVAGLTVSIESLHLAKDFYGNDIAVLECMFTNDNAEPVAFNSGIAALMFFQDGIELDGNGIVLGDDYDWASAETSIKNGATISVFSAIPLRNTDSPVEVDLVLYSMDGKQQIEATQTFEIVK